MVYYGFKELKDDMKETVRRMQETDRRMQETDRQIKETDKLSKITDIKLQKLITQVAGITDTLGSFSEEMVFPAVANLLMERGIEITQVYPRLSTPLNGNTMEVDVVAVGETCVVAIETKLKLKKQDVEDYLIKLPHFFEYFPSLKRPHLFGGVAGMVVDKGIDRFAYKKGLFVLAPSGDNVRIVNDAAFKPKSF